MNPLESNPEDNLPINADTIGEQIASEMGGPEILLRMMIGEKAPHNGEMANAVALAIMVTGDGTAATETGGSLMPGMIGDGLRIATVEYLTAVIAACATVLATSCDCHESDDKSERAGEEHRLADGGCTPWHFLHSIADQMAEQDEQARQGGEVHYEEARRVLVTALREANARRNGIGETALGSDADMAGDTYLPADWFGDEVE